jgi:hypothetical protein
MDDRVVESTGTPPQYAMVESWLAAGSAWNEIQLPSLRSILICAS